MLDEFQNINLFPTTTWDILVNILVALLCGLLIAWLYRNTYRGPGYSVAFVNSIVLLAMITSLVMMVIGNSLARAFGLVGAMSIIRFRTAVKDTQDIVFIFFSLSIGLATGVGYHRIAILGTVFIGLILYLMSKTGLSSPDRKEYLLQFSYAANGHDTPSYLPVMREYCRQHKVINTRTLGNPDQLELSYYVRFKNEDNYNHFIRELQRAHGVNQVNMFFDEERI